MSQNDFFSIKPLMLILLSILAFLISFSLFYEIDGGLKASHYCIRFGETEECFKLMESAN